MKLSIAILLSLFVSTLFGQEPKASDTILLGKGGVPGPATKVIIRSCSSKTIDTSQALYIVDGIPMEYSKIQNLDPNKIESISVLKNSSAILFSSGRKNVIVIRLKCDIEPVL